MTNNEHVISQLAELPRVTDEQFTELAHPDVRDELLARVVSSPVSVEPAQSRRLRHRLPVIAAASATAVVAGTAIGWAITNSGATDTVAVQCEINGADAIIPATSGDPVADCAAEWQRETGTNAPRLVAYDNGHGGITVAPASQQPAPSSSPLPRGSTQNVSAITLQESLDDYISGLNATCHSTDGALAFVRQELQAAGLQEWSVSAPPDGADGSSTCANTAIVDAKSHEVLLRALGGPEASDLPFMRLAQRLRNLSGCYSVGELTQRVRATARDLGLSEAAHEYQLTTVPTAGSCSIVHETVGGTIFLTIRGPNS
jgi:hypothetical protein